MGLYDAGKRYFAWIEERESAIQGQIRMDCASKISDEWLAQNVNEYGNIDAAKICGPGSDGKTFVVTQAEIDQTRKGEKIYEKLRFRQPSDVTQSSVMAVFGFIAINAIGLAIASVFVIARWVLFGGKR